MNEPPKRIISITTSLTVVLGLIIVLAFPVGYFLVEYYSLTHVLEARAETRAIYANQIIFANPDLWQFESIRLEHFLLDQTVSGEPEEQSIVDLKGQVVVQTTNKLPRPVHTVSYPLYDSGRVAGYLKISRSLRPILDTALFVGVLSLLLGVALYLTLKLYPLRALSKTLTLLNQERQRFQVIFQSSLMAVALLDRDCAILQVNPTFLDFTRMSPEELLGRNFQDLINLETGEDVRTLFRELLDGDRETFHREMCYHLRDGACTWGDLSVFALPEAMRDGISCFAMFNDITPRKRAEEALRTSENKFRSYIKSAPLAIFVADRERNIVTANRGASEMLGYDEAAFANMTILDLHPDENRDTILQDFARLAREGRIEVERRLKRSDGRVIWGLLRAVMLEGQFSLGFCQDITERKRAAEALEQSEAKYRALVETSYDWIWEVDTQSRYTYAAPRVTEILGYTPEEMLGRTPFEFMPPDEASRIKAAFGAIAADRRPFAALENVNLHKDGRRVVLETSGVPIFGTDGEFAGYRGTDRDITARKQAEVALEEEAIRRRILVEQSTDGIVVLDETGQVYEANRKYAEMLGYSDEEVRHLCVWDWDAQWTREELLEKVKLVDAAGEHFETRHRRKDGTIFDVEISTNGVVLGGRKLVFCVCRDITQRKRAEEELARKHRELQETAQQLEHSKNMLQLVIESIPVRVFWKDKDLRYLGCNTVFAHDAGFKQPQQLVGKDDYAMGWKEQAELYRADDRQVMETRRPKRNIIEPQTTPAGTMIWLDTSKVPLQRSNGEIFGVLGVYEDITEHKLAEEEIHRQRDQLRDLAARLAKIQEIERHQLAQDLHDQICQNLAMIDLTLETLKIRAQQEPATNFQDMLTDISSLVEQTGETARDIMEGLRPTVLEHFGLMGALRQLRDQFAQRTGITLEIYGEAAPPRLSPPVELALFRIVQEALANVSKHARAHQVTITLETKTDLVRLIIADDGIGFDQNQVVQPRGRYGWGLMTMTERAMAVGGLCHVESQPGQGTRVIVEVPMGISLFPGQQDDSAKPGYSEPREP